jgi:hypothetical protein
MLSSSVLGEEEHVKNQSRALLACASQEASVPPKVPTTKNTLKQTQLNNSQKKLKSKTAHQTR